jgi:CubicO group peptidase (beta-lactamase class C family)
MCAAVTMAACAGGDDDDGGATDPAPTAETPARTDADSPATSGVLTTAPTTLPATTRPATTLPATTLPATTRPATTLPASSTPGTAPTRTYDLSAVEPIVAQFVDEHQLNGAALVVVEPGDGIVYANYWGEFGPDRVSLVASASKMVTAGVLMHLADQGLLDPERPIAEYVPWAAGHNTEISVADLVSNNSGLVGLMPDPGYAPYLCQFLPDAELEDCAETIWTTPDDDADVVPPRTEYRYGGAQWQVAGAVAETVSGKSWAQLLDEVYVEPCGVESLAYANHWTTFGAGFAYPADFDGDVSLLGTTDNPHMEGGLHITPRDYAELLLLHLRGGRCGDTQVFSADALEALHTDRLEDFGGATQTGTGYGWGWWIERDGSYRVTDPGAYGAVPWLDLDGGFGAYLVLEADATLGVTLATQLFDPVESAITQGRAEPDE